MLVVFNLVFSIPMYEFRVYSSAKKEIMQIYGLDYGFSVMGMITIVTAFLLWISQQVTIGEHKKTIYQYKREKIGNKIL